MIGFVGGMLIGTTVAIALWLSPFLYRVLDPFIVVLNALPKIALVPLFFIWLGDMKSIYAMAIAISVFVTTLMLYTGFQAIDPDKVRLVQLFGASRWQVLTKIVLPGSVPTMISTLKINVGLSLVGVVVGEFQAAKAGLGYLITYGSQIFQMNLVMTSVVVLAIISTLMFAAIQAFEVVHSSPPRPCLTDGPAFPTQTDAPETMPSLDGPSQNGVATLLNGPPMRATAADTTNDHGRRAGGTLAASPDARRPEAQALAREGTAASSRTRARCSSR